MLSYKEAMKKFGNRKVTFCSYYKYTFVFADEDELVIGVGGMAGDIYKLSVRCKKEYTVAELEPYFIDYKDQTVYDDRC